MKLLKFGTSNGRLYYATSSQAFEKYLEDFPEDFTAIFCGETNIKKSNLIRMARGIYIPAQSN